MEDKRMQVVGKCFGSTVVGPRGQIVIPVEARKELGIDTGNKFLVFGHFFGRLGGSGLIFIKAETAEELLNIMSGRLDEIAKLVKESRNADVGIEGEGKLS